MTISANDAIRINKDSIINQKSSFGSEVRNTQLKQAKQPVIVRGEIVADGTGGLALTIPYSFYLTNFIVQCTATNGSGTVTLKEGANEITDAVAAETNGTRIEATTINKDYDDILTTDTITVVANGAADRAIVYLIGYLI